MSSPRPPADEFRWQAFFQHASDAIFVLSRRGRVRFVNRAFEAATGLTLNEVRGRACRRRRVEAAPDHDAHVLERLAPPRATLGGAASQVRRRLPGSGARPRWCEISYLPLHGSDGLLGIVGRLTLLAAEEAAAFTLPERLMALRDRQAERF